RVPVLPGDNAEQLAARVLAREHPLLLATLQLLASGRVAVQGDTVHIDGQCLFTPLRLESADIAFA
ncbi:phosphoribosylglycinamide formyltransferase, partial [Xanthomonas oryzae pv. oryzae]